MCSRMRWLIIAVKSQSITMAEKRLKEPFMSGRLLSLFNQQPLTVKVHVLTLNLPTTTIVAQPFNVIKWQLKFNPVA